MKKRIIALILVVATLALALVSCAYSYNNDDLSQYATFEKSKLDEILASLEIKDGDFTSDETTRQGKVVDYIYGLLAEEVKNDEKLTTGTVGAHDVLYFNYYMTTVIDGATVVFGTANMKDGSKSNVQLGAFGNEGVKKLVAEAFGGKELGTVYTVVTAGTAKEGDVAFISYEKEIEEVVEGTPTTKPEKVTYEKVVIGDDNHPAADALVSATIGTALANNVEKEIDGKKCVYSKVTVNWVVSAGAATELTDKPYTKDEKITDVYGKEHNVTKDTEVTYHVYPVNYLKVEELNATVILKTLLDSYTTTEGDKTVPVLPCFEGQETLLDALKELKSALASAESKLTEAEKTQSTAQTAYDKAKTAAEKENATEADQDTYTKANEALEAAKLDTKAKETDVETAKTNLDTKINELLAAITNGAETVVSEYKDNIYDELLDKYNAEIKTNLAKAIWEAMQKEEVIKVTSASKKAIQEIYDRMMDAHSYTFYNEKDSTNSKTHYKNNGGNFDKYLMKVTKTETAKAAHDAVWAEAETYAKSIVSIYYIAEHYGVKLTDEQIKAYKNDLEDNYSYNEYYYGEYNALAAYQFDMLMDYFLETEVDENGEVVVDEATGINQYKNIGQPVFTKE